MVYVVNQAVNQATNSLKYTKDTSKKILEKPIKNKKTFLFRLELALQRYNNKQQS